MNVKELVAKAGTKITNIAGRTGLKIQKYSPEILVVAGTASVIAGVVLCCKATLKAEEVLDQHEEEMDIIHNCAEQGRCRGNDEYTEKDEKRDIVVAYAHTVGRFVKLYAPGVGFTILGIGCFLGSYGILKKRNVALMAAYKALEASFADYRKRVIDELGQDRDRHFMYGTEDNQQGGEPVVEGNRIGSPYARFFDEVNSTEWTRSNETNKMTLLARQQWANDMLHSRGHIFLNEVYDLLGMERTREGSLVGWVKNNPRGGDNYVDFGMLNVKRKLENVSAFIDGFEYSILLDFNVDGVIWDLI